MWSSNLSLKADLDTLGLGTVGGKRMLGQLGLRI